MVYTNILTINYQLPTINNVCRSRNTRNTRYTVEYQLFNPQHFPQHGCNNPQQINLCISLKTGYIGYTVHNQ